MDKIELIHHEAQLLDEQRHEEWLDLFTEQVRYWAPHDPRADDPLNHMNLLYDDLARLKERVSRLEGGDLHAQDPRSQTLRLLGYPVAAGEQSWNPPGEFDEVLSLSFLLTEYRNEMFTKYTGRYTYWLTLQDGEYKIAGKKIALLGVEGVLENVTFLL